MHFRLSLAMVFGLSPMSSHAGEWFPAYAGINETQYLIYSDECGDSPPVITPTLTLLNAWGGHWRLDITHDTARVCLGLPPPGAARTYAFAMPDEIGGVSVAEVQVRHATQSPPHAGDAMFTSRPPRHAVPPSIAGLWGFKANAPSLFLDGFDTPAPVSESQQDAQALVISVSHHRRANIAWVTHGPDGAAHWMRGRADLGGRDDGTLAVPLRYSASGRFAGDGATDNVLPWGQIEFTYLGCGRMSARWMPDADTGFPAGSGALQQAESSLDTECDLEEYARLRNGEVSYREFTVVR